MSAPAHPIAAPRVDVATLFLAALGVVLAIVVLGGDGVPYKPAARALAIAWPVALLLPAGRARLPYRSDPSDLPLACFVAAAAAATALGGGRWGDMRSLLAAVSLGLLARTLAADPVRRRLLLHMLGATVALVLARELAAQPTLLLPREAARYGLVTANPNVLGFLFAMLAPLFLAAALAGGRDAGLATLWYALAVAGTLVTYSRVAAVGLAVGSVAVGVAARRRGALLGIGVVGAIGFVALQRPDLWVSLRAAGDADRLRIMGAALAVFVAHPILGVGFGIHNLETPFRDVYFRLFDAPLFRFHSGNQLVDLLAGTGIVGTAAFVWWAVRVGSGLLRRLRVAPDDSARIAAVGAAAAGLAIAVMCQLEPALYQGKLVLLLFVALGWMQAPAGAAPPTQRRSSDGTPR